jgi:hypothetical protein
LFDGTRIGGPGIAIANAGRKEFDEAAIGARSPCARIAAGSVSMPARISAGVDLI